MSEDRNVRLQQKCIIAFSPSTSNTFADALPVEDDVDIIPYTVWGKTDSVVLRIPTELLYHDLDLYDKPLRTVKTSWVNYHFKDEVESNKFQSALMWKLLLHSFRTRRTMLAHEGFVTSTFSLKEQLCGLENLRLWRDEEAGCIIAMIHFSPNVQEGYLSFRLSGPGTMAKVTEDGEKWVKIRKLNITLEPRSKSLSPALGSPASDGSRGKKSEPRNITAIKVEFSSMEEKYKFLEVYGRKGK